MLLLSAWIMVPTPAPDGAEDEDAATAAPASGDDTGFCAEAPLPEPVVEGIRLALPPVDVAVLIVLRVCTGLPSLASSNS